MMKKTAVQQASQTSRPPVVAVLGHVDHGKTTLLDTIRKSNVASREHGGITQAIGAFTHNGITFIDTPGHEAFTKMRSRGASAADVAILVVASDDGVMPQTKEAIAHIKEAKVPFVVALTKTDVEGANLEKVKQQLLKEGVSLEGFGGDVPVASVSAKTGKGIPELLEVILLVWQMAQDQGKKEDNIFKGVIIEAKKDRRKGVLVTVIIKNGILTVGDEIVAEAVSGKVRALLTDTGESVKEARSGMPVEILGFSDAPPVGAYVVNKKEAQEVNLTAKPQGEAPKPSEGNKLALILKTDTQGSLEAILHSLPLEDVVLLLAQTGDPTEGDVLLAKGSNAIIVGFNTAVPGSVAKLAETEGVIIKSYKLIYELLGELGEVISLTKLGKAQAFALGKAVVLAVFPYDKKQVAGSKVLEGRVAKGDKVQIERDGQLIGEARIVSLRQGKDDVGKVETGAECGILISIALDFEPADMILSVR